MPTLLGSCLQTRLPYDCDGNSTYEIELIHYYFNVCEENGIMYKAAVLKTLQGETDSLSQRDSQISESLSHSVWIAIQVDQVRFYTDFEDKTTTDEGFNIQQ